jgi:hypothetical protein
VDFKQVFMDTNQEKLSVCVYVRHFSNLTLSGPNVRG